MKTPQVKIRWFTCALLLMLIAGVAMPQSGRRLPSANPQSSNSGQDDSIKLRADEVLLNVTVIDPYGRQATDLAKDNFIIAEDGQRQELASFLISSVPANVVLMLDASGSVAGAISSLPHAAIDFLDKLGPADHACVIP